MAYAREWPEESGPRTATVAPSGRSAPWSAVPGAGRKSLGGELFHAALPAVLSFESPRAWAFALLGIHEYLRTFQGEAGSKTCSTGSRSDSFRDSRRKTTATGPGAKTSSPTTTHACPGAHRVGRQLDRGDMVAAGLVPEWLCDVQRSGRGSVLPIGSNGFYPRSAIGRASTSNRSRRARRSRPASTRGASPATTLGHEMWRAFTGFSARTTFTVAVRSDDGRLSRRASRGSPERKPRRRVHALVPARAHRHEHTRRRNPRARRERNRRAASAQAPRDGA